MDTKLETYTVMKFCDAAGPYTLRLTHLESALEQDCNR